MKIRIYYEDTDCGNIVYYANYLKFMERGRTDFLRERGLSLSSYYKKGYNFVIAEAHIKYKAPARYDEILDVNISVKKLSIFSIQ